MIRNVLVVALLACWATLALAKPPARAPAKGAAKPATAPTGRPAPATAVPPSAVPAAAAPAQKPAESAETGVAITPAEMREDHFADRKVVATLATGESVQILGNSGAWLHVKSAKATGWLRALAIRRGAAGKGTDSAGGVLGLKAGRAGTGKVVATTGIRGLTEEELKAAKFNAEQVALLESYTMTRPQAQDFAKQGNLQTATVAELPAEGAR